MSRRAEHLQKDVREQFVALLESFGAGTSLREAQGHAPGSYGADSDSPGAVPAAHGKEPAPFLHAARPAKGEL